VTLENITDLRKQIEGIDYEIFYKIVELSLTIKCYERKTDADISNIQHDISELESLAPKKNLDADAVSRIFNEIMLLVNQKEVKHC
jgi:hypothetical protein